APGRRPERVAAPYRRACGVQCRRESGHAAGAETRGSPAPRCEGVRGASSRNRRSCERLLSTGDLTQPAQCGLQARLHGVDRDADDSRCLLDTQVLVVMERDSRPLLRRELVERASQVEALLAGELVLGTAQAPEPLGERLKAMPPTVQRDAFIHGDSCEPGSGIFVTQAADPLPGLEKCFLDRVLGQ